MTPCFSLLEDDSLAVCVADAVFEPVGAWLPLHARPIGEVVANGAARIHVAMDAGAEDDGARDTGGSTPSLMRLGPVSAHALDTDTIALRSPDARGLVSLAEDTARIGIVGDPDAGTTTAGLYCMLTLSAALLLGRMGAALVHAGAVADHEGRVWLLVGDTHAGKTTTSVALADAGWRMLADDQVVLRMGAQGWVVAEGWPRRAHLDAGYETSAISGTRIPVDLRGRWGAQVYRSAPVHAVILPRVVAAAPTAARRVTGADVFTALVRQSPWLMADRVAAPGISALLRSVAGRPGVALDLGADSYGKGTMLAELLTGHLCRGL